MKRRLHLVRDGFDWENPRKGRRQAPLALHGTSSVLLESIRREGLKPYVPLFTDKEMERLGRITEGKIPQPAAVPAITTDPEIAISQAKQGPALLSLLRERVSILVDVLEDRRSEDARFMARIAGRIDAFYEQHRPVVLLIDLPDYKVPEESIERFFRLFNHTFSGPAEYMPEGGDMRMKQLQRNRKPVPGDESLFERYATLHRFYREFHIPSKKMVRRYSLSDICQHAHRSWEWDFGGAVELEHEYSKIPPKLIKTAVFLRDSGMRKD